MPTPAQQRALHQVVWRCRLRYPGALEERQTAWERCHVAMTSYQQQAEVPALKAVGAEYAEGHAHGVQAVLLRVERACPACLRRVTPGEQPGYARVQGYHRSTSCTSPPDGGGAGVDGGLLRRAQMGRSPRRRQRPLDGTPKPVTRAHEAEGGSAGLSCAAGPPHSLPLTRCETGIAGGVTVLRSTADGALVETPCPYRTAQQHRAKAQRRGSRRTQGSTRRRKVVALLKRKHQPVQRQRSDCHHTTARALRSTDATRSLEDLRVAHLAPMVRMVRRVRTRPRAPRSSAAGWAALRTILAGTAAAAGQQAVAVPPAFSSQDGSGCGDRVLKRLSVRTQVGPHGGLILDRDENAARTRPWAGQALRGRAGTPAGRNREAPSL